MARRHNIGNIRGSSVANQSASRVVHPGFSVWRSLDVLDGTFSFYNGSGSTISANTVTGANGTSFELDHTKDSSSTGYWTGNSNAPGRYYKKLIGPNGQLKWSDQFTFELCIEKTSADSEKADGIAVGIAESGVASPETHWGKSFIVHGVRPLMVLTKTETRRRAGVTCTY